MAGRQRSTGGPGGTAVGDGARRGARAMANNGARAAAGSVTRPVAVGNGALAVVGSVTRPVAGNGVRAARSRSGAGTRP